MKAICIERFGGPEVLAYRDVAKPIPRSSEVLVRVAAASVNPRDWLLQEGRYQFKSTLGPFPIVLGSDFSGTVEAVGTGVSRFKVGDEVFGMQSRMGAFAEWIAVSERILASKPREVSHSVAAAIPCAGLTAYQALVTIGKLRTGQAVLVNGATGGVGSYAVQIARALGGRVTAVASQHNADLCLDLGADQVIDRATTDFTAVVREQNIILDAVGRSNFAKCKPILAARGHYITTIPNASVARAAVTTSALSLGGLLPTRRCHMVLVRSRPADLEAIAALVAAGRVQNLLAQKFPLADAAKALAHSKSWHTTGKLVLEIAG
jgi:NADPH:quinone reductase-like Zn-dependent oxidoreductase